MVHVCEQVKRLYTWAENDPLRKGPKTFAGYARSYTITPFTNPL